MKKRILIIAVLIVVVMSLFFLSGRNNSRDVGLSYVGFTNNTLGKPEALFLISNSGPNVTWNIFALQQNTEAGWRNVTTPLVWSSYRRGDGSVIGVPVPDTNDSWRVVLFCQQQRDGAGGFLDRGKEVYEKHVTRNVRARYDGRKYYVTNDVLR